MAVPKWTDERTQSLVDFVGSESPVSQVMVANAAEELETSSRSVSSKLRKMGYDVELASASASKSFSDEQEATLSNFVQDNSGQSIQGKILSMQLTEHVKPAPKQESVKTYSDDEESTFIEMVNNGDFVEAIAEALGRSVNSIRGKALSLLRAGEINAIPKQEHVKGNGKADVLADLDISDMSVEDIADEIGKTVRGVKTMLTRRGLRCADYDGSAKKNIG